ncbi:unnamed protein product [Rotaria socialis]|uniref:Uncharacterized protein n=1 Tax=Rotaria socialis TaxID=392032 RepID=A0A820C6F8_9BILA|nr:unnamed protein product [Rotaria socialis]CAF3201008.1 unnamed protein product [Rotaria socialis]CAF4218718.1 unnamed protein product [Rotaria socialis]CAF4373908.1 unnamed protein product [Rotaria socialis]
MSSCCVCYRSSSSIRCLRCQKYFCLVCSGVHRQSHLLDALDERLTSQIDCLPIQFDENSHEKYRQASDHLQKWIADIRCQFENTIHYQLEKFLKTQFELLKMKTDEYVQEYVQYLTYLRSNVRYAKQRPTDYNYDHDILRLISIEKELLRRYDEHLLEFRLDTNPIDFTKYINIEKKFHESPIPLSIDLNYRLYQPMKTLNLQSSIQHIASSCLDLFVYVLEPSPIYPCLLEFSTASMSSKISLVQSIEFPMDTRIIDMRWSIKFNCLFLLTSLSLHKYEKYEKKIQANIIKLSNQTIKWHRLTTNRFGIYILNENNSIEFYNSNFLQEAIVDLKDLVDNICLVYDLQGQADCLCTLTYTKESIVQIDLFSSRRLELKRTLKLSETLQPPLKLINANRRNTWIIIDCENHRLIIFDDQMKNIKHISLTLTPNCVAVLDDKTLVVASPDIPGAKLSFYSPHTILQN